MQIHKHQLHQTLTVSEADNDGKPTASGVAEPGSTVTVAWKMEQQVQ